MTRTRRPRPRIPVILSYGFGVESTAILLRWILEPETRYFVRQAPKAADGAKRKRKPRREPFELSDLTVIASQTGDEHRDTQESVEAHVFPLLREHGIRFVEVARKGEYEEDGIVIFQDSTEPRVFHREGAYKLSDHLKLAGTVPQFGGEHRCALHYKAFVIEHWLKYYFGRNDVCHVFGYNRDEQARAGRSREGIEERNGQVRVAFGYNRDEQARADNSDAAYERRNGEGKEVRVAFGFNRDEQSRADRAAEHDKKERRVAFGYNKDERDRADRTATHDTLARVGFYPLIAWGWSREDCENYIFKKLGVRWQKSACVFCPFNREASKGTAKGVERLKAHPEQTADALLVEYTSLCMNPRGALFNTRTLHTIALDSHQTQALAAFEAQLARVEFGLYEVKRLYSGPGTAARSVIQVAKGTREQMSAEFDKYVKRLKLKPHTERGIRYGYFAERGETYPAVEGFMVIAPASVGTKVRGQFPVFEERFLKAARQLGITYPLTPGTALVNSPLFFGTLAA